MAINPMTDITFVAIITFTNFIAQTFHVKMVKARGRLEGSWGCRVLNAWGRNRSWPHAGLDVGPESIPDYTVVWRSNEHQAETQGT